MLTPDDFDYHLPKQLIANEPLLKRDGSKLLVFSRTDNTWSHHYFWQLPQVLAQTQKKYLIICNNSRVIPARLYGEKPSGGHAEILLVKPIKQGKTVQEWECLTKPGLKVGVIIKFPPTATTALVCDQPQASYTRHLRFNLTPTQFSHFVHAQGHTPTPPYIHTTFPEEKLRQVYQTVYAQPEGSVAAPTAGLHFTPQLLQQLANDGHTIAQVTLHVGLGTFLGVKAPDLAKHHMHSESFQVAAQVLAQINQALTHQQPILTIGTTATRVLESLTPTELSAHQEIKQETSIFLYPPAKFNYTGAMITNFHLPRSTLLMLVAAFTSYPNSTQQFTTWQDSSLGQAYQDAIAQRYRFFSFGDGMLLL